MAMMKVWIKYSLGTEAEVWRITTLKHSREVSGTIILKMINRLQMALL